MSRAASRLRERTVVEVSTEEVRRYAGATVAAGSHRHFLIRGNVTTTPSATLEDAIDTASHRVRYELYASQDRDEALLFMFQSAELPREQRNIALVLSAPLALRKAYLGCYVTS